MPVIFIEAPQGIREEAKKRMMQKVTTAVEDVYPIGETLIFLREYPLDMVALNGGLQSENQMAIDAVEKTKTMA